MKIALTGATGFLGRYILRELNSSGNQVNAWFREGSDTTDLEDVAGGTTWIKGELGDVSAAQDLLSDCEACVHAALFRPGRGFRGDEGDLREFLERNFMGTIQLIEAARAAGVKRFIFISTCAVHEKILDDRLLDEAHPLWPTSHYGAHKAALEKFIHSFGMGEGYEICSLRPTGIYGVSHPVESSKWYELIKSVAAGSDVVCERGGKEVHAADVAKAVSLLLTASGIAGEAYNCYDIYLSQYDVATLTKEITGSSSTVSGEQPSPKHQIDTTKIQKLGMKFGGRERLRQTIEELLPHVK